MSILKIVEYGNPILREKSKEVTKISKKIKTLITDMLDTMYHANGVGLAAPQVGENLRIFVIDVSDPNGPINPLVFVNPKIIKKSGAISSYEGCLSFPKAYTIVRRYKNVMVKALDINGRPFVKEAKDGELLARAIQHEFDHLDGKLFIDHCRNRFDANNVLAKYNLPSIQEECLVDEPELEEEILKWEKENPAEAEKLRKEIEELESSKE
ncbi:MAG: peptide deformylase [Candidatus Gastranaerophilales bacterium]|nr:peptide deformylase [Candidatus Gastranaerophilales bacterium]